MDGKVVGMPVRARWVMSEDQSRPHLFNDFGQPGAYLLSASLVQGCRVGIIRRTIHPGIPVIQEPDVGDTGYRHGLP